MGNAYITGAKLRWICYLFVFAGISGYMADACDTADFLNRLFCKQKADRLRVSASGGGGGDFQKALVPNPATLKLYRRKRYPDFRDEAVDAGNHR